MSKTQSENKKINILKSVVLVAAVLFFITYGFTQKATISDAADGQVGVLINYFNETATVTSGTSGSTKFYFSKDEKKTWELIDTINSSGTIDISTLLKAKAVNIYFKGNKSITPEMIVLPAEDNTFKPTYQSSSAGAKIVIPATAFPVEYRIGVNGQWKVYDSPSAPSTAPYEINGATFYFRTMATSVTRAGKVVVVKIPKRPTAPSAKLDGSKLCITGFKYDLTEYRTGDSTEWNTFKPADTKSKTMNLNELFNNSRVLNEPLFGGIIEIRTKATTKKPASAAKVIEVPTQPMVPATSQLIGTTLTITDATSIKKYEYTKVDQADILKINVATAKWTAISSSKPVVIKNASVGEAILVRLKSTSDSKTKVVTPASIYFSHPVLAISPGK